MDRNVVVTGASTGIGRATALWLDARGWRVFASVRKQADADALAEAGSDRLVPLLFDVTDDEAVSAAAAKVADLCGEAGLQGLVNNAGIGRGGPIEYIPLDDWKWQFEVNLFGVVRVTQAFMPALRKGTGRIVTISSIGGLLAWPLLAPYHASKYAVEAFSDSLRQEIRPLGMYATVIEPGSIQSDIWGKAKETEARMDEAVGEQGRKDYGHIMDAMANVTSLGDTTAVPADRVASTVAWALTSRWPAARYRVGPDARLLAFCKFILPDRLFEGLQRLIVLRRP